MADIPAANVVKVHRGLESNIVHLVYKVTGDASGITITTALSRILCHAVGNVSETAGYNPQVTWVNAQGGTVVTYGAAPSSSAIHFLHLWGN